MKHLYWLSIAALVLTAVGCDDSSSSEVDSGFSFDCQAGTAIYFPNACLENGRQFPPNYRRSSYYVD